MSRDLSGGKAQNRANDTDRHVGTRIRERRIMLGYSQQQMADLIGVTYQQAHKYERGINRISAGRLFEIAQVLGVPVGSFFEGLAGATTPDLPQRQRMCLELSRNFASITSLRQQEALSQFARVLAEESAPQTSADSGDQAVTSPASPSPEENTCPA